MRSRLQRGWGFSRRGVVGWAGCVLLGWVLGGGSGLAQDFEPTTFWKRLADKGVYERLWEAARLYENEDNRVVQAVSLIGRYHGQAWGVEAREGDANGWENRRLFAGVEAQFFHQLTVQAQVRFDDYFEEPYDGLYQAFARWSPHESLTLGAGRIDFLFASLERSLSSVRIPTIERGLVGNQVFPGELVGTGGRYHRGRWTVGAGTFSGKTEEEFTDFDAGFGLVAGVAYDLPWFFSEGGLHLDYLFNDGDPRNSALRPYDHVGSLWYQGRSGALGVGVDFTFGHGMADRRPLWGLTVLPTWDLWKGLLRKEDSVQAVLRYQYAASDGFNGLNLPSRYEQEVVPHGAGDEFHAVYVGLNYLAFGHRLKFMTGLEYSTMHDSAQDGGRFSGWTYQTAVRVFF